MQEKGKVFDECWIFTLYLSWNEVLFQLDFGFGLLTWKMLDAAFKGMCTKESQGWNCILIEQDFLDFIYKFLII